MSVTALPGKKRDLLIGEYGIVELSPEAADALEEACGAIRGAPKGAQTGTLRGQARAIGFLAGTQEIPQAFAIASLLNAASALGWQDPPAEVVAAILKSFNEGLRQGWRQIGLLAKDEPA